ncbi:hypothetical protein SAMN05444352_106173 [Pseudomonas japonica]|uniref:Lipoprotein n=2 Tax=Pseudomonas japonica TaxID=256466 RepID=A0A239DPW9_9PSED|nr:hypothetical protein [Pseudomonas japonica]SNS33802.1 hypothetical protein SAMN05444352_106173 [Pseudomonas japonica]
MPSTLLRATTLAALLAMTGCVSFNVTGPIAPPAHPVTAASPRTAQIADVVVSAPGLDEATRKAVGRALTTELDRYVDRAGYFHAMSRYPTRLEEQDVLLKLDMTSLKGHRAPHPGYFPGALLTLTLWIWVNGPIYVDRFDLAGDLVIVDRNGVELARARDQIKFEHNVGLYGSDYWTPTIMGGKQLTQLVGELLDNATTQLAKR